MDVYHYRATRPDGTTVEGFMQAIRADDVRAELVSRDLRVGQVEKSGAKWYVKFLPERKVKAQEIVLVCRQLATFVAVGIPITTALQTIGEGTGDKRLKAACVTMVADVQRGVRLSDAFSAHPLVFPQIVSDMVRASEESGNLDHVMRQAAKSIEREASARQKVQSAMIYPAIICALALLLTVGLITFVLPQFRNLYAELGVPLPAVVRGLLNISDFMTGNAILILLVLLVVIIGLAYWLRTPQGKYFLHRTLLRLPLVAPMVRTAVMERFCRTLSDLLSAGVPIMQTFSVLIETTPNLVYRRALRNVVLEMGTGDGISGPLRATQLFPPVMIQMVRVGEETGRLDTHLAEMSEVAAEELDFRIKRMTALIEPTLIVGVGLVVGFVAVTMVLSIYSLAGNYSG